MLHLLLSASLLGNPRPCDHFFDGATTADIGRAVCGRDEASKLDPGGRVLACRPAKVPEDLQGVAIMDAEILEAELNLVGASACPVDMHLMIASHTPPALQSCVCETFPGGEVPTPGAVVCAKDDPAGGALHCYARNADYRGDDGGALTWSGCRSDMTPCKYAIAVAPSAAPSNEPCGLVACPLQTLYTLGLDVLRPGGALLQALYQLGGTALNDAGAPVQTAYALAGEALDDLQSAVDDLPSDVEDLYKSLGHTHTHEHLTPGRVVQDLYKSLGEAPLENAQRFLESSIGAAQEYLQKINAPSTPEDIAEFLESSIGGAQEYLQSTGAPFTPEDIAGFLEKSIGAVFSPEDIAGFLGVVFE